VAVDRHKLDDFKPWIFKTADYGQTWSRINHNIPNGAYVRAVREDPHRQGLLYAGTETGPFVSFDEGGHWQRLHLNLPVTPIHDLVIHDNDLAVATDGRSFWILDDLEPLRQANQSMAGQAVVLYKPQTALRLHYPEEVNRRQPVGDNPPPGAIVDYYLKEKPACEITLDLLDGRDQVIRHYYNRAKNETEQPPEWPDQERPAEILPAEAGMNRFWWDLRYESPVKIPVAFYAGIGPRGPLALPGHYTVRLAVDGKNYTAPLEVKLDPRVHLPSGALEEQFALSMKVRDAIERLHQAVNQIRNLRSQFTTLKKWTGDSAGAKAINSAADKIDQQMSPIEAQLIQVKMKSSEGNLRYPNMLNEQFDTFRQSVESADAAPTQQQLAVYEKFRRRLDAELDKWKALLEKGLPELNELMRREGVPALNVSAATQAESTSSQR